MWDLALDGESGDFIFGPHRDLLEVTGPELTNQRILIRCRIPLGSYIYEPAVGSQLQVISRQPSERQLREAPTLVEQALEPMQDIHIISINPEITDDNRLHVGVDWSPAVSSDEEQASSPTPVPVYDASVTV